VAALSRACATKFAQPELPARPGYGQQSDSHRDSDIQAGAVSKIVSNKADVHPLTAYLQRNVGGPRYGAGSGGACPPASELTGAHAAGGEEDKGPSDSRALVGITCPGC
jgi:hypothetical protein